MTSFEDFERKTRDQLARIVGAGGFEPAEDIQAITINRWPHGHGYEYSALFDPNWPEAERPNAVGRKKTAESPSPTPILAPRHTRMLLSIRHIAQYRNL